MKNNKAKDAKDGDTQKRKNRAYNLAAKRLHPSKNPPEARPEKCGTGSEQQEVRPRNVSGNRESCEDKKIADESRDLNTNPSQTGQFQRSFSIEASGGAICRFR
jgi:hypothetical protein